ncbi:MAG: efflux transporter outer membrane subunit [Nitrospirae bacterium]|nr:efflux transporter outer membrane subunit [Nitrospirota bacterium]MBF0536240.1 efflux transporter outer membrane subunit [Nitrospirota bacterium]MBF0617347.1 efflux transporter outer membrane subunit [Nitrospirota bacterium]
MSNNIVSFINRSGLSGFLIISLLLTVPILLASCKAGKDYVKPEAIVPTDYKEANIWKKAARPLDNITAWWEVFNDSQLNEYEKEVSISNQNLIVKEAQFRQARALVDSAKSRYFPSVGLGTAAGRSRSSENVSKGGTTSSAYSVPVSGSWDLDLWGSIRRTVESNVASAQASFADLEALRLSTHAELAQDYFQLCTLDTQKQLLDETVEVYKKTLEITRNRYESGVVSKSDVLHAETQLKTTIAQAIDLRVQRSVLEHAIALLMGKPASSFSIPITPLKTSAPVIPAGVPSELLERRADIAAAERRVAASNAQIGAAEAAFFPAITLTSSAGYGSSAILNLLTWPSRIWAVGMSLSETIFSAGLRESLTEQARATYDATVAQYRQTVLTAFQEVEDSLSTIDILTAEQKALDAAVKASEASTAVALNQYKAGIISYVDLIAVQSIELNNKKTAADVSGRLITNSVLLIKALGGPWNVNLLDKVT